MRSSYSVVDVNTHGRIQDGAGEGSWVWTSFRALLPWLFLAFFFILMIFRGLFTRFDCTLFISRCLVRRHRLVPTLQDIVDIGQYPHIDGQPV